MFALPSSRRALLALAVACSLAGCGGVEQEPVPPARSLTPVPVSQVDHERIAQQLYLAYLGRAAEPAGLAYFADVSRQAALPMDMGAAYFRYGVENGVRQVLDSLAESPEAVALYSGSDAAAVTAMYRNLFNRDPDPGGLAYWSGALSSGALRRGQIPVALLAGAALADLQAFDRKTDLAVAFTAALDTPERIAAYQRDSGAAALRQVLAKVSAATTDAELRALVDEALAAIMRG